jgi:ArsR family transcriptional regulator
MAWNRIPGAIPYHVNAAPSLEFTGHAWHIGPMTMKANRRCNRERYVARAKIAKAMAHPSRLMMLEEMHEKECSVTELTELVGSDQSTVSKHLAVLKNAGLVQDRKEGVMVYYRLRVPCLRGFWDCIEGILTANLRAHQEALR